MYFTIAKNDYGYLIDSIPNSYRELRCKFPNDEIYYSDSPILSICANESFVVTGSEEGNCRVWPVGFEEFIMEAKHDSGVCSVDISYDSMEILIGTLNGSIGNLEIKDKDKIRIKNIISINWYRIYRIFKIFKKKS